MGLSINQNIAATNAYRNLSITQNDLSKSLEKLSSGFRINDASDDAAGMVAGTGFTAAARTAGEQVKAFQNNFFAAQASDGYLEEATNQVGHT